MSFIKSDSLFQSVKNFPFTIEYKPNDSTSNIFRSIFENIQPKPRSVLIQSLFDVEGINFQPNQSFNLADKLMTAGYRQNPVNTLHYNWTVCKNGGLSQEEDNSQSCNQKCSKGESQPEVKQQQKSVQQIKVIQQQVHSSTKKIKNQTKNIPKNYGKAIILFVQKYRPHIQIITEHFNMNYDQFLDDLKKKKKAINTIADLRSLWSKYQYAKCMRVVSCLFLRKHALPYIFDSRICTFGSHIKYRQRLLQAVSNPQDFRHIKDY